MAGNGKSGAPNLHITLYGNYLHATIENDDNKQTHTHAHIHIQTYTHSYTHTHSGTFAYI